MRVFSSVILVLFARLALAAEPAVLSPVMVATAVVPVAATVAPAIVRADPGVALVTPTAAIVEQAVAVSSAAVATVAPFVLSPAAAVAPVLLSPVAAVVAVTGTIEALSLSPVAGTDAMSLTPTVLVTPEPTPVPTPLIRVQLQLKDGQSAPMTVLSSDSVFLELKSASGNVINVPWLNVAALTALDPGTDISALKAHITNEAAAYSMAIQAKDPSTALIQALWPGVVIHGWGHRYAGDPDAFIALAGAELFGVFAGGFGAYELAGPTIEGENKDTALALAVTGGVLFATTWAWDLILAPSAAKKFNKKNGLTFEPTSQGAKLAVRF